MTERRPLRTELAPDARTMARGAAVNVGGALLTTVLSFALSLLITHEIRATPFGLYSIALVTVLLGQVPATLGLDVGAVRFVALRASQGDVEGARASLHAALGIVVLVSGALAALLYWQAPWLSESFFHKPAATDLVRLAALALPALALTRVVIGGLQGLGLMRYSALVNPIQVGTNIAVAVPVLVLGYGAKGLTGAFLAVSWSTLAVAAALLARALPRAFVPTSRSSGRACAAALLPPPDADLAAPADDPLDRLAAAWAPAAGGGGRRLRDRAAPALAGPDDLDLHRADVRAPDRRRGRARRPCDAGGDAEARHLLERLARDPDVRAAAARARGTARHLRARLPNGRRGAHDPRRRPDLQRCHRPARPGDQHVRPPLPDAREQRGRGGAQHRRLPDPDPALRPHRRRLLHDRLANARQPRQARAGASALRNQSLPHRDGKGDRGRASPRRR